MSKENPGLLRRMFRLTGKIFGLLRTLIKTVFFLILIAVIVNMFGPGVKPLPEKAVLTLTPSGILVEERRYSDPLTQLMQQNTPQDTETPIRDLIVTLDAAATDTRITGLVLDLNHLVGGGITKLKEVGAALGRFKKSGKTIVAISDNYNQDQYLLASYADEIHLNPMGAVMITGYGYYGTYLKSAADKLKIQFHIFRVGEYKSAVEPFIRDDMSSQAKENASQWLTELWSTYTSSVETHRELEPGTVDNYVNSMAEALVPLQGNLGLHALNSGLVDQLSTRPQVLKRLKKFAGTHSESYKSIDHKRYLSHIRLAEIAPQKPVKNTIGVIVASGTILDGEQAEGNIGGDSLAQLLRDAQRDASLKALVLRIDSPGGSAFASEIIRNEITEIQKTIPVIVSMGSMAASGGYWIAAGADEIWAMPTTITGSIGVFGIISTFERTLADLGIHSDGIGTTLLADMNHIDRPISPEVSTITQLSVDNIYNQFLALVATGRNSSSQDIHKIAQGRVWTGTQAQKLGLVDKLGTLKDAINSAANKASLTHWNLKYISRPLSVQERILKQLADSSIHIRISLIPFDLTPTSHSGKYMRALMKALQTITELNDPQGLYLQCIGCEAL